MAAIGQLKTMVSGPARYPRVDGSVFILLTSELDDGAIHLLPEVLCDRCRFTSMVLDLYSGPGMECGVPSSTSGPRLNGKDSRSEQRAITVEEIVSAQRTGANFGEAQKATIGLCRARDSRSLLVIGETQYFRLVRHSKPSLSIKLYPTNPTALAATHINAREPTGGRSPSSNKSTQSKPSSGYMKPLAHCNTHVPAQ